MLRWDRTSTVLVIAVYWGIKGGIHLMRRSRQKGSLTVEAAIVLVIFIFGYASIVSVTSFIRAQMIIQYGITQAAREISSYCYLVSKTGIMDDSGRLNQEAGEFKKSTDNVIDTVVKLYDAVDQGTDHITSTVQEIPANGDLETMLNSVQTAGDITQQEFQNMVSSANTMVEIGSDYFSDPKAILKGLGALAKDEALSAAKSYVIAAPISKALVKKQIALYGEDAEGRDVLEKLGVVNGMDGLSFIGSTLFNDGESITVQVSYTMKVRYPGFDQKEFHFIQTASTKAWGSSTGGRPWRE